MLYRGAMQLSKSASLWPPKAQKSKIMISPVSASGMELPGYGSECTKQGLIERPPDLRGRRRRNTTSLYKFSFDTSSSSSLPCEISSIANICFMAGVN